ncbi:MAG: damage-control phosphatase ARMT1 family protein [Candidatus Promineifilaceae bacterium]|nr:damage-control phosphatase ARMT1 family protein [Candidatus Promineifilaceae bacterium]
MADRQPRRPLPEPLRGCDAGTFTQESIVHRLPEIGQRMLQENDFPENVVNRIRQMLAEIPASGLRPIEDDDDAPDQAAWSDYVAPYVGQDWLQPPWFFIENYFYRRILAYTGYFHSGPGLGMDPFAYQKRQGLADKKESVAELADLVQKPGDVAAGLTALLRIALWGNQGDLSMWPAGPDEDQIGHGDEAQRAAHTLVDDADAVATALLRTAAERPPLAFLVDNAGFELVTDLALAAFVLQRQLAATVTLHTKPHPTFVSDATNEDVWTTVKRLVASEQEAVAGLGRQLALYLNIGRLRLRPHFFWTSPLPDWRMPTDLRQRLGRMRLIVSKGDAHYRRLLGDRHWSYTAPFAEIVNYMPADLVALRTLKSEVAAGLSAADVARAAAQADDWLVNGRWGLIQFYQVAQND